jgi:ubiquitin-conjugating enzyme E2 S
VLELHTSKEIQDLGIRVALNEVDVTDVTAELDGPPGAGCGGGAGVLAVALWQPGPSYLSGLPIRHTTTTRTLEHTGTPYEGGLFRMRLSLPPDFPASPPKGSFLTQIWHPNVSKGGEICVNVLKVRGWVGGAARLSAAKQCVVWQQLAVEAPTLTRLRCSCLARERHTHSLQRDWQATLGLRHVLCVIRCLLIEPYPESALNEEAGKLLLEDYDEYAARARLMTSLHAQHHAAAAAAKRPHGPLTASGANSSSGAAAAAATADGGAGGGDGSPLVKKARPELSKAASKVKKSLKRL